jgi:metal-responsive CopG/Arc/MetJ family transcriptional regulator
MRITVDIPDTELDELLKLTGEKKKSAAVNKVVTDYLNRKKAKEFGRLLREGAFDFDFTNDDVEKLDR